MDDCTPKCPPRFIADGYFTAECPAGTVGAKVYKHVQAESQYSVEHAKKLANEEAKRQAEAVLVCTPPPPTVYTSTKTQSYEAFCDEGFQGVPKTATRTATRTSTVSQADADNLALEAALDLAIQAATALLICTPDYTFNGYAQYTATCGVGYEGDPVTREGFAGSFISQADADANALAQAMALAFADLVCTPASFYAQRTATAYCGDGTFGPPAVGTGEYTSLISQQDAEDQAYALAVADAQSKLVCQPLFSATATQTVMCGDGSTQTASATGYGETYEDAYIDAANNAEQAARNACPVDPPPDEGDGEGA